MIERKCEQIKSYLNNYADDIQQIKHKFNDEIYITIFMIHFVLLGVSAGH